MTEWSAELYRERSRLQQAMAAEVLPTLDIRGWERVLDVGCGDGSISCDIAIRVPSGLVIGVDASVNMIEFASQNASENIQFAVADARALPFLHAFDLVVSFNALHWVQEQDLALTSIHNALKPGGRAHLRMVPMGTRKSLESVLEETRRSATWSKYFYDFRDPYLRMTQEEYCGLAEAKGFRVDRMQTAAKTWDFGAREKFSAFCAVTLVAWTKQLPEPLRPVFINDVLDRYRAIATDKPGEENTFRFYQMTVLLTALD